ncbi:2-amino-4-hydroxy-6-hydroxymethyldihydropteridine diphosphokinase [Sphingobacterium bovistauri]|uniref:2-amino-4-hydroxy-6-hydroxymethyldihydropteridine pyrophosphokinase n=1 Tax=Sphingobacterium bovistauri TaxID=2781959 RepID=A0ABS7Z2W8_9SPHI|nr:2-amino-4-hydroxy-6-hydroxymethyldihydropteridine diphosphokinase [Sphingobacterium bovistauri]MCA5004475.1 2-amino-4-hydroxy-6-hydroxymethyldihydropteridine diphosphokinase [Sphingobacterium bovistauri]
MNDIYILLGANLGNPRLQLQKAKELLSEKIGTLLKASSLYQSEAWGVEDQPLFLNQVLLFQTTYSPHQSLTICQEIENELGRVRKEKWGARMIDIDILYYNDAIIESTALTIPHPYIQDRKFTLQPLCEIANNYKHPKLNVSNEELLLNCIDNLNVVKTS